MPQSNKTMLQLFCILRAETDANRRLSASMLLERLTACGIHSERRSIYRTIAALRQCGIPIEKTTTGYYYAHTAAESDAYAALAAAVQAAGFLSAGRKQALLEHIKTQAGPCASESALSLGATISGPSAKDDALFIAMQCASRAISGGTQLTFLFSTSESERLRARFADAGRRALREAMEEVAPILEKLETAEPAERTQLERSLNKKLGRLQKQSGNPLRDQMAEFEQTAGSLFEALRGIPAEFSAMLRGGDQGGNGE